MLEKLSFSFKKLSFCLIGVTALFFWTHDVTAQDRVDTEIAKVPEKIMLEDHTSYQENGGQKPMAPKAIPAVNKTVANQPKKDNIFVPEGKKPEPIPSTLSQNIFLYIVDKFKAN